MSKTTKCAWCGREGVAVTGKGTLKPHLTPGNTRCVAGGQSAQQSDNIRSMTKAALSHPHKQKKQ